MPLQLDASFHGPTYGGGVTLQGGFKVSDWRDLTAFVVADANRTKTELSFKNETLIADTKPVATVFSARVGLHGTVGPSTSGGDLARCDVSAHPARGRGQRSEHGPPICCGPIADGNTLLGGLLEFGKDWMVLAEGGLGARKSILAAAVYRF